MMYCGLHAEKFEDDVDEVVEIEDGAGYLWRFPADVFPEAKGCAEFPDAVEDRNCGVALNAYGEIGAAEVPRYPVTPEL